MDALLGELRKGRITAALDVTDPLEPFRQITSFAIAERYAYSAHRCRRHGDASRNGRGGC